MDTRALRGISGYMEMLEAPWPGAGRALKHLSL